MREAQETELNKPPVEVEEDKEAKQQQLKHKCEEIVQKTVEKLNEMKGLESREMKLLCKHSELEKTVGDEGSEDIY